MKEETVSVKILKTTVVNGENAKKGQIVECSPLDARYLVGIGKAETSSASPRKRGAPRGRKPATETEENED